MNVLVAAKPVSTGRWTSVGAASEYCNFHAIANMGASSPSGSSLKTDVIDTRILG